MTFPVPSEIAELYFPNALVKQEDFKLMMDNKKLKTSKTKTKFKKN